MLRKACSKAPTNVFGAIRLAWRIASLPKRSARSCDANVPVKPKVRPIGELAVLSVLIGLSWAVFGVRSVV